MLRSCLFLAALASLAGALSAASPFNGPVEAVTFDAPTKSFRAVHGTLGSAMLDAPLLSQLDFGSVAPQQDYGIAYQNGQLLLVSGFASGQPAAAAISGTFALPDGAAWSGDGTAVVIYSAKSGWLELISGLPAAPVAQPAASTANYGPIASVAADQTGQRVFAAIAGSGVYQLNGSSLSLVLPLPGAAALSISDARGTLYVLDTASHQVYEVSLATLAATSWTVGQVESPVTLIAALDSSSRWHVYVAGAGNPSVLAIYDADAHSLLSEVNLSFAPTALRALGASSFVARDRQMEGEPLWTFTGTETDVTAAPSCPPRLRICTGVARRAIRGGDGAVIPSSPAAPTASAAVYFIPATPLAANGGAQ